MMNLYGIKRWENQLPIDETMEVYKLVCKLTRSEAYTGNGRRVRKKFISSIGDFNARTSIMQIYTEFGMISEDECPYHGYLENIGEIFGLDRHIVDISCGYFPVLAEMIAREQLKTKAGTVTAIDEELFITHSKYENMKLIRGGFTLDTDPESLGLQLGSSKNLLVGIFPCEVTQVIIDFANKYGMDFYIAFCACPYYEKPSTHLPTKKRMYEIYKEKYIANAEKAARNKGLGIIKTTYLGDSYYGNTSIRTPIIYRRKRRK